MTQSLLIPDMYEPPNDSPLLRVLNFSAGRQSYAIAKMVLAGEIKIDAPYMVVSADPGNEHKYTYRFRDHMLSEFRQRGIHAVVAKGPKMLDDLRARKAEGKTRIDNAALWSAPNGQLSQTCTREFKIRPMYREVLKYAYKLFGRSLPDNSIECWIGFCWDERHRIKPLNDDRRMQVRYPLIDRRMTKDDILDWYIENQEEMPPPSVCNHCWANGVETLKRIHDTDPEGWKKAVEYDELSRDMTQFGIRSECFVSRTLVPLRELADSGFSISGKSSVEYSCDSGFCFV